MATDGAPLNTYFPYLAFFGSTCTLSHVSASSFLCKDKVLWCEQADLCLIDFNHRHHVFSQQHRRQADGRQQAMVHACIAATRHLGLEPPIHTYTRQSGTTESSVREEKPWIHQRYSIWKNRLWSTHRTSSYLERPKSLAPHFQNLKTFRCQRSGERKDTLEADVCIHRF